MPTWHMSQLVRGDHRSDDSSTFAPGCASKVESQLASPWRPPAIRPKTCTTGPVRLRLVYAWLHGATGLQACALWSSARHVMSTTVSR